MEVCDDTLRAGLEAMIRESEDPSMSSKTLRRALEAKHACDLTHRKEKPSRSGRKIVMVRKSLGQNKTRDGPGCGHEAVPHGDHIDYLVDGHLHHPHDGHCDNHGPVTLA